MSYDFNSLKKRGEDVLNWLGDEFGRLKTTRATPAILDKILVEAYGSKSPIAQIASISIEDPKTLRVLPWDKNTIVAVQSAIDKANLGISTAPDEQGIRVIFPEMTEETRLQTIKNVKEKLEEARISIRKEREAIWHDLQKKEKSKELSEDEKFRKKEEMEKIIAEWIERLEKMATEKEKEVLHK